MLYIGVFSIALCAVQVICFPASSRDTVDDTKVLKCIVEVISGTLSKPNPVPASQDCLETLRGDERIISILRHQNLLKELQELASQGAMERLQKQKKNGGFAEELSGILEKQSNKPLPSEKFQALLEKSPERDEVKKQSEEENRKRSSEPTEEEDSAEELESNEISKREETSEDEEIDNHITDEINEMELAKDNQEDISEGRMFDEKESMTKKDQDADKTEEDPDKENHKQDSNETDNEEDDTQREDNSMKIPEDFNKDSTSETDSSKETKQDMDTIDCTEENPKSDDDASSKDLEDSKRWNKMDELAKELRAKKCASRSSEDDPDQAMKILPKEPKYDPSRQEAEDRPQWQRSREDSSETEAPMLKRAEERKEEEGSANRKTEDQELESLAAIEAELENVAHKLRDLRRG